MSNFQYHYYVRIICIIMNFFANLGRVNAISVSKIAVKSHKFCVKTSFCYAPEIIACIFNQQVGGRGVKDFVT